MSTAAPLEPAQAERLASEPPGLQRAAAELPDPGRYRPLADEAGGEDDPSVLLARFFDALAAGDAERMAACYHPMASYSNPVFPDLRGALPATMWRLALAGAHDLRVRWQVAYADERKAQVTWEVRWRRGRRRHRLDGASTLAIWDGRIVRQVDEFRFARWAAQALGLRGLLLGRVPAFQRAVRRHARRRLDALAAQSTA